MHNNHCLITLFAQHKSDFSSQQTHLLNNLCGGFVEQKVINLLSPEVAAKPEPLSTYKRRYFLRKLLIKILSNVFQNTTDFFGIRQLRSFALRAADNLLRPAAIA